MISNKQIALWGAIPFVLTFACDVPRDRALCGAKRGGWCFAVDLHECVTGERAECWLGIRGDAAPRDDLAWTPPGWEPPKWPAPEGAVACSACAAGSCSAYFGHGYSRHRCVGEALLCKIGPDDSVAICGDARLPGEIAPIEVFQLHGGDESPQPGESI